MTSSENGQKFSSDELYAALMNIEDLMDRLLTPYILLGNTADAVKFDKHLEGDGIDVGIKKTALTQYVYSILDSELHLKPEEIDDGFTYMVGQVPVRVKVYKLDYQFFKYPDVKVYMYGTYSLPNPYNNYWRARGLIR